ncbi:MAG: chemotaxis protein CheR [Deltaproteobacteria bacterium RBG_16_58_17]|nr:MAG: chemotaxis protein CheR [Deltaproteobacteria bacterium RBG_16_58_17]OHE16606.1 MAG: chemotaxis protein CheR [Syntrophobacterales bacterium GWC2_56_13]
MKANDVEKLEVRLLLEAIHEQYGYDFRDYAFSTMKRRIVKRMEGEDLPTITSLLERVLRDPQVMERLLMDFSITTSAMFRDPGFFRVFRQKVVPAMRTYPFLRIWHAGCSCGEEVYSLAILLKEENLYERSRIYATDFNEALLEKAKKGIFPLGKMKTYTQNYIGAGGKGNFSDYYNTKYDGVRFQPGLAKNIVFAQHNLVTDGSFNEFNVILCRNVMIYFNRELQNRVHGLLYESLMHLGFLGLGEKENLLFSPHESAYGSVDDKERLFRKVR